MAWRTGFEPATSRLTDEVTVTCTMAHKCPRLPDRSPAGFYPEFSVNSENVVGEVGFEPT